MSFSFFPRKIENRSYRAAVKSEVGWHDRRSSRFSMQAFHLNTGTSPALDMLPR